MEKENEKKKKSKIVHYSLQAAGIFLIILGIILMPLPGPGTLVVLLGVLILGEESSLGKWIFSKIPENVVQKMPKKFKHLIERRRSNS